MGKRAAFFGNKGGKSNYGVSFIIARVVHVVYGPYLSDGKTQDKYYRNSGDIGTIRFVVENSNQYSSEFADLNPPAKPAWASIKHFPVECEYVYIIAGPGVMKNQKSGAQEYYYLPPFNLWASANHNAFPALDEYAATKIEQIASISEVEQGAVNSIENIEINYPFENNFEERGDVRELRQFVGDLTVEGRWGNSIRLGSSLRSLSKENNWAISKNDGDPIIIIRNGQGLPPTKNPWDPTVEDINIDMSSIYLTAGQEILMTDIPSGFPLNSFNATYKPTVTNVKAPPPVFRGNQNLSPQTVDKANNSNQQ